MWVSFTQRTQSPTRTCSSRGLNPRAPWKVISTSWVVLQSCAAAGARSPSRPNGTSAGRRAIRSVIPRAVDNRRRQPDPLELLLERALLGQLIPGAELRVLRLGRAREVVPVQIRRGDDPRDRPPAGRAGRERRGLPPPPGFVNSEGGGALVLIHPPSRPPPVPPERPGGRQQTPPPPALRVSPPAPRAPGV